MFLPLIPLPRPSPRPRGEGKRENRSAQRRRGRLAIKLKSPGLPGLFRILLWLTDRRPASTIGQSPALFPLAPFYGERVGVRGKAKGKTGYEFAFARCFRPSSRCRDLLPAGGEKGSSRTVLPAEIFGKVAINQKTASATRSLFVDLTV